MDNKATVTVKMSKAELETLINSLDFKLSLNVPIDSNYLKPFAKLKNDLTKISQQLDDAVINKKVTKEEFYGTPKCEPCEDWNSWIRW